MHRTSYAWALLAAAALALPGAARAQNLEDGLKVTKLVARPAEVTVRVGQTVPFRVIAYDAAGKVVNAQLRIGGARGGVSVDDNGITGVGAGRFQVFASVILPPDASRDPVTLTVPVTVSWPTAARVTIDAPAGKMWVGASAKNRVHVFHQNGEERPDHSAEWNSSNPSVIAVDRWGNATALSTGNATITATVEGKTASAQITTEVFPASQVAITVAENRVRTGDVVHLTTRATTADGRTATDAPISWTYTFTPDDSIIAPGAAGLIADGKFVAEVPGQYTLVANTGNVTARKVLDVRPRDVVQNVQVMGQGQVHNVHTSDLWIFDGVDGRDYAITGTWGADGYAYFWDVTDPSTITKTDSIHVDARTVNDVKVSPDGRYAALSREGASNRRNGVVILDMKNPAHPVIASVYEDGLTGGVHNMFATNDYLFALSAGDKYIIIDVRDLKNPKYVSEYNHPDSRIHDVWVADGMAYSSEWGTGVVVVDVGNGRFGGSIEHPKFVTNVPYPVGATHASFPYFQKSTEKMYLFLGDEIMSREGAAWSGAGLDGIPQKDGTPSVTRGYYHIIDFTDPMNPKDVARYEAKEFGTHNLWVEDDVLYSGYYEGGMRVVDVSGELMGNLASQGREIAVYKPYDPNGYVKNAPMTWGAQPHKGYVFFSDFNSGLWAVKLTPRTRPVS
jgi:hypothetical protein